MSGNTDKAAGMANEAAGKIKPGAIGVNIPPVEPVRDAPKLRRLAAAAGFGRVGSGTATPQPSPLHSRAMFCTAAMIQSWICCRQSRRQRERLK